MSKFEVGRSYGVQHFDDRNEVVTVATRCGNVARFTDGRVVTILRGVGPDGERDEVIRIDEQGCCAVGGVVRACAILDGEAGR